tara:strand:+ start:15727 stop:15846 length:120 start_codon:yes stop_codon:yes gene_type:complete
MNKNQLPTLNANTEKNKRAISSFAHGNSQNKKNKKVCPI